MEPDYLIQQINDFFLSQYNGSLYANTFLAFEPLGLMVSPDDFKFNGSFNPTVAQQQVSIMADTVPAISDVFEPDAFNKISEQYGQLVGNGDNLMGTLEFCGDNIDPRQTDQYLAYFGFLKKIAQQKFSRKSEEVSLLDPSEKVMVCNVTPSTWYDHTSPIWQQKTFRSATNTADNSAAPTAPVLNWKLDLNLQKTPVTGTVYTTLNTHLNIYQAQIANGQPRQPAQPEEPVIKQAAPLMLNKDNYSTLRTVVPFSQMVNVNRVVGLNNNAVTQPVTSSQLNIDFSYSLVRIERDWMYQPLIDKAPIWYSLTNLAGDYSTGENSANNQGLLRCVPKAMIVVKDLHISAEWSADDIELAAYSFGFGCFNISNSLPITSANQKLSVPGIQVIAWICEVLPQLPVNSDPGMVDVNTDTTDSETTGVITTGTSVDTQTAPIDNDDTHNRIRSCNNKAPANDTSGTSADMVLS